MPVYIRFLQNGVPVSGTVRSGAHTPDWTNLRSATPRQASEAIPEVGDEVLVGFEAHDHPSTSLGSWAKVEGLAVTFNRPEHAPKKGGPAILTAQIEFTQTDRSGSEIADLRVQLHDVRIVRSEYTSQAGSVMPVERMVIAGGKMTLAGTPESAPDISHQVQARVAKAQVGRHHLGGILAGMGDGSVRFVK
jgi:hypothetical protein